MSAMVRSARLAQGMNTDTNYFPQLVEQDRQAPDDQIPV